MSEGEHPGISEDEENEEALGTGGFKDSGLLPIPAMAFEVAKGWFLPVAVRIFIAVKVGSFQTPIIFVFLTPASVPMK